MADCQGTLIVDEEGRLAGIITRGDLIRAIDKTPNGQTVLEAGSRHLIVTFADEILHDAARLRRHEEEHHRESGWLQAFSQ